MSLSDQDRRTLAAALGALLEDRSKAFDDALWLGFGDRWWPLRQLLTREGYIALAGAGDGVPSITDRGRRLARRLSTSKAVSAG